MYIDEQFIRDKFNVALEDRAQDPVVAHTLRLSEDRTETNYRAREAALEDYDDDPKSAFTKIERLLSVRDRSISETRSRLQRDRFTEHAIEEALERAMRCGYLDDARFADGFIRSRLRASKGIEGIVRDLKTHGIDAHAIPGFPDTFLEEQGSQFDNAVRLLQRKPPRAKNKRQAAYAKLIRNGFSSSVASAAVKSWSAQSDL